jgi:exportin-7
MPCHSASNLKIWVQSEDIIDGTVQLLSELSVGYSTVRMLLKLQTIQYILVHHSPQDFPFLSVPRYLKLRTSFFTCLGRMLFASIEGVALGPPGTHPACSAASSAPR